jgi:hypothetical protein
MTDWDSDAWDRIGMWVLFAACVLPLIPYAMSSLSV